MNETLPSALLAPAAIMSIVNNFRFGVHLEGTHTMIYNDLTLDLLCVRVQRECH